MPQGILHTPDLYESLGRGYNPKLHKWQRRFLLALVACGVMYLFLYFYLLPNNVILDESFGSVNESLINSRAGFRYVTIAEECSERTRRCYSVIDKMVDIDEGEKGVLMQLTDVNLAEEQMSEVEVVERHLVVAGFEEDSDTVVRIFSPTGKRFEDSDTRMWEVDHQNIRSSYVNALLVAPFLVSALSLDEKDNWGKKVLEIGLGGGSLDMFLHQKFPQVSMTSVEFDPMIVDLAKKWFGVVDDRRHKTVIDDGLSFINTELVAGHKYDAIFIDACDMDKGIPCPIEEFRNPLNLYIVKDILKDNGAVILNILSLIDEGEDDLKRGIIREIARAFTSCLHITLAKEVNEILVCTKYEIGDPDAQMEFYKKRSDAVIKALGFTNFQMKLQFKSKKNIEKQLRRRKT